MSTSLKVTGASIGPLMSASESSSRLMVFTVITKAAVFSFPTLMLGYDKSRYPIE